MLVSTIAQICEEDFWLTSDADYHRPSKIWRDLASVRPSCMAEEPDMQPVRSDFRTIMDNLCELQSKVSNPDAQPSTKGFLL